MQLDLLQEEITLDKHDSPPVTLKKTRPERHPAPALKAQPAEEKSLPPLPESLRPPFLQSQLEHLEAHDEKAPGAFKTISEAAKFLGVPQHVLRFWESRFTQIKPLKMRGGRRYYRPEDMETLSTVKHLLYKQGYTIKGAKKAFSVSKNMMSDTIEEAPTKTAVTANPVILTKQRTINSKQQSQLSVIRHELIGMRETLKAYL